MNTSPYRILTLLFVGFALVLLQPPDLALAEGTETLGPANISLASGTSIVADGVGLENGQAVTGTIDLNVPANAMIRQVLVYWSGGAIGAGNAGDDTLKVNGIEVTGTLIGGPTFFFTRDANDYYFSTYRADITNLGVVVPGANTVTISDMNFAPDENNGAGIMAIIDDGSPAADIQLRDGLDLAFINFPGLLNTTVPQTTNFAPATVDRMATLSIFLGSVDHTGEIRPFAIEVHVDDTLYLFLHEELEDSHDGNQWDSPTLSVPIHAGATSLTVQLFSRDDNGDGQDPLAASLSWVASAMVLQQAPPVSVGDYVWSDDNENGLQDAGETGVSDVTVRIFAVDGQPAIDLDGAPVPPQITDNDGLYLFTNLPPGSYYVVFDRSTLPAGYLVTTPNIGGDDAIDSDADPTSGQTAPTPFLDGEILTTDRTLDMGIVQPVQPVSVGDFVWRESPSHDLNGLQDDDEPGVPDVTVRIFTADGQPAVDLDGAAVPPQATDSDGLYLFTNLPPGSYYVVFDLGTLPPLDPPYRVTTQNAGADDAIDSDADPDTGQTAPTPFLAGGQQDLTLDMGIWYPPDFPVQVGVGDFVWFDNNRNGLQDTGEPGVPNVAVRLFTADGQPAVDRFGNALPPEVTDGSGLYHFTELITGTYYVVFDLSTLPANFAVTTQNAGSDDAIDSDADSATGQTAPTPFLDGELLTADLTLDMGIVPPRCGPEVEGLPFNVCVPVVLGPSLSLGNKVWLDDGSGGGGANDGLQNGAEPGMAGVTINLLDGNGAPVLDANQQPIITVTAGDGCYLFDDLPRGDYLVEIAAGNFGPGQPLFNHTSSSGNSVVGVAPAPNTDRDLDDNGNDAFVNGAIRSGVVTLDLNTEPLGEALCGAGSGSAEDPNSNLTVDFGFVAPIEQGEWVVVHAEADPVCSLYRMPAEWQPVWLGRSEDETWHCGQSGLALAFGGYEVWTEDVDIGGGGTMLSAITIVGPSGSQTYTHDDLQGKLTVVDIGALWVTVDRHNFFFHGPRAGMALQVAWRDPTGLATGWLVDFEQQHR